MHSSRMRTGRSLSLFREGGVCTWSVGGVYLVPGGCTWSRGVYLVRGGVPGPGGCAWSGGVYLVPGGGGSARYTPPGPDQVHPPPVNRITDACKNITLAQLRCGR